MKQTFTQILTALYLFSSIGFGGVQQYCNSAQKVMLSGEAQCCSDVTQPEPEASCCSLEIQGEVLIQGEKTWSDGCCVFQQVYHQVDTSPTPHQDAVNQVTRPLQSLLGFAGKHQSPDYPEFAMNTDPSDHLNTPLLI